MKLKQRILEIQNQCPNHIKVSKRLSRPHPLVYRAKNYLDKKSGSKWRGFEEPLSTSSDMLSIEVSKHLVSRALRFMDALIKLLIKRGHSITIHYNESIVNIKGIEIKIKCREKCNRVAVQDGRWVRNELVPNGKLSFKIRISYSDKEWVDGYEMLEDQLCKIAASLETRAEDRLVEKAEWAKRREEQERQWAIRKREEAKAAWEMKKIEVLLNHSDKWQKANALRAFLKHIVKTVNEPSTTKAEKEWLKWAFEVLQSVDPLSNGIGKLLEQYEFPEEAEISEY